jgi:hypothetical protein
VAGPKPRAAKGVGREGSGPERLVQTSFIPRVACPGRVTAAEAHRRRRQEFETAAGTSGGYASHALEEAAEEGGVFVADAPADLVYRLASALEAALGIGDA